MNSSESGGRFAARDRALPPCRYGGRDRAHPVRFQMYQLEQLLQVAPVVHAHDGLPSQPEVPTSVFSVHGDGCISGAMPVSRLVA